jgi:shikimate kinase
MNVVLLGFRCAGKTSVGRLLAAKMQRPFRDTDEWIQRSFGKTVREIVADQGWDFFRQQERRVVRDLAAGDGSIIALGGGAILDEENVGNLKLRGFFVWLTADIRTILRRMIGDGKSLEQRPSLFGDTVIEETRSLLKSREPFYAKVADLKIDTSDRDTEEIAEEICGILQGTAELNRERRKEHGG